jgi:hypothetical protein
MSGNNLILKPFRVPHLLDVTFDHAFFDHEILNDSAVIAPHKADDENDLSEEETAWTTAAPDKQWLVDSQNYVLGLPKISQLVLLAYTFAGNKILKAGNDSNLKTVVADLIEDTRAMPERYLSIAVVIWMCLKAKKLSREVRLPEEFDGETYEVVKGTVGWSMFSLDDWKIIRDTFATELQKIIAEAPRPKGSFVVFRGEPDMMLGNPNGELVATAFTSTSLSFPATLDFANLECCVKQITIVPGTKALFVGFASIYPEEFEVLLPFETKMTLTALPTTYIVSYEGDAVLQDMMIVSKFAITA